jgi:hypothetical protein
VTIRNTAGPARAQGTRRPRRARGYPSDLTDAQWQVIAPHLPAQIPGRRGRPRISPPASVVVGPQGAGHRTPDHFVGTPRAWRLALRNTS